MNKCQVCGANLSIYNPGTICSPCIRKRKELNELKLVYSEGNRLDYIYDVLEQKGHRTMTLISAKPRLHI